MSLLDELKRRNVFRMGTLYAVSAWLLLQVADVLSGLFALPDWSLRFVGFVLLLGFPVALVFSWIYELTPEGLMREKDVERETSVTADTGRRMNAVIVILLAIAVGVFAWDRLGGPAVDEATEAGPVADGRESAPAAGATTEPVDRSVAVLPFENLSDDPEQGFFVDGLAEEILNRLAHIPELLVTARTSSFQFRESPLGIPEIADRLGVAHVVEGSVRRFGDRLRVTAQLIRADDGFHVWSENYDREVDDLFRIQDDIAEKIANALDVYLDDEQRTVLEYVGTRNVEAFELWIRALQDFDAYHVDDDWAGLRRGNELLRRALELDPGFSAGYVYIADLYTHFLFGDEVRMAGNHPDGLTDAAAYEELQRLLLLAEQHARTENARTLTRVDRVFLADDWNEMPVAINQLVALLDEYGLPPAPNQWGDIALVAAGKFEWAVELTQRDLERNPLARFSYVEAMGTLLHAGELDRALAVVDQGRRLTGDHPMAAELEARVYQARGDFGAALTAFDRFPEDFTDNLVRSWALAAVGRCDEAHAVRERAALRTGGTDNFSMVWIDAWLGRDESLAERLAALDASPVAGGLFARAAWVWGFDAPWDLDLTPRVRERFRQLGRELVEIEAFEPLCS